MKWYWYIAAMVLFTACGNGEEEQQKDIDPEKLEKPLEVINKGLVKVEKERIDKWAKRYNLPLKETGTGLHYYIYEHGDGPQAEAGLYAEVRFTIKLLDGTLAYDSDSIGDGGTQLFLIDKEDLERGLHEGIKLMRVGDKAKLVIPPHLAHGLVGDRKNIPVYSTIVYDIELVGLKIR